MRMRAETTGERAAKKALVALQRKSRKKQRTKSTYGLECAEGLRGAGTSQRIRGPKLRQESVCERKSHQAQEREPTVQTQKQGRERELLDESR
jgi:hypothetical protein